VSLGRHRKLIEISAFEGYMRQEQMDSVSPHRRLNLWKYERRMQDQPLFAII
jgi:hypothetical protein